MSCEVKRDADTVSNQPCLAPRIWFPLFAACLLCGCAHLMHDSPDTSILSLSGARTTGRGSDLVPAVCETESRADTNSVVLGIEYSLLTNRQEKLLFCIRLLDDNSISMGTKVSSLKAIFGADVEDYGVQNGQGRMRICFADWIKNPWADWAPGWRSGWYLAVYYDPRGIVHKYFVSNIWKAPHMWGW